MVRIFIKYLFIFGFSSESNRLTIDDLASISLDIPKLGEEALEMKIKLFPGLSPPKKMSEPFRLLAATATSAILDYEDC